MTEPVIEGREAGVDADELLACPFCGSSPVVTDRGPMGGGWSIACICQHGPHVLDHNPEKAVEMWNRRAPVPPCELQHVWTGEEIATARAEARELLALLDDDSPASPTPRAVQPPSGGADDQ